MLLGSDDVAYSHLAIIGDDCEDEQGVPVGLGYDEVLDRVVRELDIAPDHVVDDRGTVFRYGETQRTSWPALQAPAAAVAVVSWRWPVLGTRLHLLPRAVAGIEISAVEEQVQVRLVERGPLRLPVGTFVPIDAQPAERVEYALVLLLLVTLSVGVLDA